MLTRSAVAVLTAGLLAGQASPAWSQIPTGGIDPVDELTEVVNETVEETVGAVNDTTEAVTQTVVSSATDSAGGGSTGGATSVMSNDTGGTATGNSATSGPSGGTKTGAGTEGSGRTTAASRHESGRSLRSETAHERRGAGSDASILSLLSPLLVRKTNDADADGSFSDTEVAPTAEATVTFRVEIVNVGATDLVITEVRDALEGGFGRFDIPVCDALLGERIQTGATVDCAFTLEDYAPEGGQKVNTLQVTAVETTSPSTSVSGSDTSTVAFSEAAVLGITINPLATTGADVNRLLRLALALLTVGSLLFTAGRIREKTALLDRRAVTQ